MPTLYGATIYCPDVTSFKEETAEARVERMLAAIDVAWDKGSEIFLGPEFFFTHHSHLLGSEVPKCIAYSAKDEETFRSKIKQKSLKYNGMLMAVGTCYEELGGLGAEPHLFNTAFVYLGGKLLASGSKHDISPDKRYAEACDLPQVSDEKTGIAFKFEELSCYLQICTDTTTAPDKHYDLSLIPAFKPGGATIKHQKRFENRIVSDGSGHYYIYRYVTDKGEFGTGPILVTELHFV